MSEKCPIIAIDPGNRQSAYCVIDCNTLRPLEFGKVDNEELRNKLVFANEQGWQWAAIEMVASYGMAVGREVFDTVLWIGRFYEALSIQMAQKPRLLCRIEEKRHIRTAISAAKPVMNLAMPLRLARKTKKGRKIMTEKTMGAIPVSALERLEQSAVKLSLITFCLRHEELKAAPDAAEIHSIKSDLSRALQEVSANATACALSGGIPEKAKASPPAGAEPKRVQRKEIHKGTAYGVLRLRCPKCGDVFGRFLREPSASVTCRCGGEVQLDNLTRYEFTCPCCDFEAHGRTNLEDPEITVPCKCGNPVTMKWDRNKRMYHE